RLRATTTAGRRGLPSVQLAPRLGEDLAEDRHDRVELLLARNQRRRELDHRVAAVVRAADQPALEQPVREEAAEEPFRLVVVEGLARRLVLDELERVEVAGAADVPDDRQLEKRVDLR